MFPSVFVRGSLTFSVDDHALEFSGRRISTYGVCGLPWDPLVPSTHFGRYVVVSLRLQTPLAETFTTEATIIREESMNTQQMGLRFRLSREQREKLAQIIAKHGHYPTDYVRKYPRIPQDDSIPTYPAHVIVTVLGASPGPSIIFSVRNLSPSGVLLSTENQLSLGVLPGARIEMLFDPRGGFPFQVAVEGLVCRTLDEMDPDTKNLVRSIGVKFQKVDEGNRAVFLNLLRDILEKMKAKN